MILHITLNHIYSNSHIISERNHLSLISSLLNTSQVILPKENFRTLK